MTVTTETPLHLSIGAHAKDGRCCAMNLVSWEIQPDRITDEPDGVDRFLAHLVHETNDALCGHGNASIDGEVCTPCSVKVINLAHAVTGSARTMPDYERCRLWVGVTADVLRRAYDDVSAVTPEVRASIEDALHTVAGWVDGTVTHRQTFELANALDSLGQLTLRPMVRLLVAAGPGLRDMTQGYIQDPHYREYHVIRRLGHALTMTAILQADGDLYQTKQCRLGLVWNVVREFQHRTGYRPTPISVSTLQAALDRMASAAAPSRRRYTLDGVEGLDLA